MTPSTAVLVLFGLFVHLATGNRLKVKLFEEAKSPCNQVVDSGGLRHLNASLDRQKFVYGCYWMDSNTASKKCRMVTKKSGKVPNGGVTDVSQCPSKVRFNGGTLQPMQYMWWGNPSGSANYMHAAADGPNTMLGIMRAAKEGEVKYYYQKGWNQGATAHEVSGVATDGGHYTAVELEGDTVGTTLLSGTALEDQGTAVSLVVQSLQHYRLFSAIKDILALCFLYKNGGVYADTTTMIPTDWKVFWPANLGRALTGVKFVGISNEDQAMCAPESTAAQVTEFFGMQNIGETGCKMHNPNNRMYPYVDVWYMSAPAEDEMVKVMIENYIARATAFGLHTGEATTVGEFDDVFTNTKKRGRRNAIVSGLITTSVGWAISATEKENWSDRVYERRDATKAEQAEHIQFCCEECYMCKHHGGTWR
uniref:Uncharacterized protein n=1 Tax=Chromera velia CCMP2878 TaxID=1169474 RepID=A0A0G4H2P0_9ALVE|eukprot:Cvel_24407.t1-p1 / transcript=Cvel_24407.t1 / gene=Cvel_24407 / organism=Chromera_velia_CCMP2878 / gene_product=hypothetical protein / transcript_product=hypothetical protein / location=Cvel_scaffold2634:16159-17974(-) / protein_length=420 / sequence_SO=supercontig / SO=protein_coding / is_pseudo=false